MIILGIETSCDETAVCLVEATGDFPSAVHFKILGNSLFSQIEIHKKYGGVFPMMAKREHSKNLIPLLEKTLEEAGKHDSRFIIHDSKTKQHSNILQNVRMLLEREPELSEQFQKIIPTVEKPPIDLIAVTNGPGLEPALWVGVNFAKALSEFWDIPVAPVNHMEGHILISLLQRNEISNSKFLISKKEKNETENYKLQTINFPVLALLVSGGHTELVLSENFGEYKILGATRDDAVGEAFDKVARILGLPYPGGPPLSALAEEARNNAELTRNVAEKIKLPRPMIHSDNYDFSFSGLKTAVLYAVKKLPALTDEIKMEIAREFEDAVVETLISKTKKAILEFAPKSLVLGGGVAANKSIRSALEKLAGEFSGVKLFVPEISHSSDNAVMIALAGYADFISKEKMANGKNPLETKGIIADGNLRLDSNTN